jgi:hypothetical protein
MSAEDFSMHLRSRRSALTDISNKSENNVMRTDKANKKRQVSYVKAFHTIFKSEIY